MHLKQITVQKGLKFLKESLDNFLEKEEKEQAQLQKEEQTSKKTQKNIAQDAAEKNQLNLAIFFTNGSNKTQVVASK